MRPTALRILFCVFSIWSIQSVHAQGPKKKKSSYILFTGLVLTSDSLKPIPYVNIRSNRRGLIGYSDVNGYFDVVVKRGDTIFFEQVEKVSSYHVVPWIPKKMAINN